MHTLLFDTDVLIDYLRGNHQAKSYIDAVQDKICISAITVAELYAGVRQGQEHDTLATFITTFDVISLNESIAKQGGLYRNQYQPSHGTGLADALIAATATEINAQMVTLNHKHYPMLNNIIQPYKK